MGERFTTTTDGARLCLEAFGDPGDPAVLLIAGGGESMDFWEDGFCTLLRDAGRYVVRYDQRDTGRSTHDVSVTPGYGVAELAADALAVLDELGVARAHLVGLSLGGSLAWTLAVRHPERVVSLTLLSSSPPGRDDLPGPTPELAAAYAGAGPGTSDPVEQLVADLRLHTGSRPFEEERVTALARRAVARTVESGTDPSAAGHRFSGGDPADPAAVTVPTLVLHGTADPLFPLAHGAALAAAIPGAGLVELPGVGHEHPPPALWRHVVAELAGHTAPVARPAAP